MERQGQTDPNPEVIRKQKVDMSGILNVSKNTEDLQ